MPPLVVPGSGAQPSRSVTRTGTGAKLELERMTGLLAAKIRALRADTRGVTALEYALIGLLVAIVIIASLITLTASISTTLTYVAGRI